MISQLTAYLACAVIDERLQTAENHQCRPVHTYSLPVVRELPRPVERNASASTW